MRNVSTGGNLGTHYIVLKIKAKCKTGGDSAGNLKLYCGVVGKPLLFEIFLHHFLIKGRITGQPGNLIAQTVCGHFTDQLDNLFATGG